MFKFAGVMAAVLIFGGCVVFKPATRHETPIEMPSKYSLYAAQTDPGAGPMNRKWRGFFDNDELSRLVARALAGSFDVETARARFAQAWAAARKTDSSAWPALNHNSGAQTTATRIKSASSKNTTVSSEEAWTLGLGASYEIDLWGRVAAMRRSGAVKIEAAREDLAAAAAAVAAKTAELWIDVISVRQQIVILEKQIENAQNLLNIQNTRFVNGVGKAFDISQQAEALAAIKAEAPMLRLKERQLMTSLAFLLGMASAQGLKIEQTTFPQWVPMPRAGLPADLLAHRPDVRAAGLRLKSADWEVSAARSDRLPSISLSAQSLFSNGALHLLFNQWISSLGASLTGPIFDGGRRGAEVERTRAVAKERLALYAQTVAKAVKEVEDSMAGEEFTHVHVGLLEDQLKAARATTQDALLIYLNGRGDYVSYLNALTGVQRLERRLAVEKASRAKARVALVRALGGDWVADMANDDGLGNDQGDQKENG